MNELSPAHALAVSRRFLDWEDVDFIGELIGRFAKLPHITVVDLGAGSGTTALSVFEARPLRTVKVITVDISEENVEWARKAVENIGRLRDWQGVCSDSVAFAGQVDSVHMVMLDTSHEYEPTVKELEAWRHKIVPGGIIWCHDYRGPYEVNKAVNEAVTRGEFTTIGVKGLGWAGYV